MNTKGYGISTSRLQAFTRIASGITVFIGTLVLAGWVFDIPVLTSILPTYSAMTPITALCFVFLGFSLWMLTPVDRKPHGLIATLVAQILTALVLLVGFLVLLEYALGWNAGISRLLIDRPGSPAQARIAISTAFNFLILGFALLMLSKDRWIGIAQIFTAIAAVVSLIALTGYIFNVRALYAVGLYKAMSLSTALLFIVLCSGILTSRPNSDIMSIIRSDTAGGILLRRLLPVIVVVPFLFGWLRWKGQEAGLYETEFGLALTVVSGHIQPVSATKTS